MHVAQMHKKYYGAANAPKILKAPPISFMHKCTPYRTHHVQNYINKPKCYIYGCIEKTKYGPAVFSGISKYIQKVKGYPHHSFSNNLITRHKFTKVHGLILNFPAP